MADLDQLQLSRSTKAFASDLWDDGIERAADLAIAVEALQKSRAEVGNGLTEAAWATDLSEARRILAGRGTDLFRFFSSEWRVASRFVRSFLTETKVPLDRQLALLDALSRGQAALKAIKSDDELGRSAFAGDWRGDRSLAEPLLALVEWMRSLKGLGSEPRVIASRRQMRQAKGGVTMSGLGHIVDTVPIRERPAEAEDRAVPGHWEGDLLCGANHSYMVTLVERASRFAMLLKVPGSDTATVIARSPDTSAGCQPNCAAL